MKRRRRGECDGGINASSSPSSNIATSVTNRSAVRMQHEPPRRSQRIRTLVAAEAAAATVIATDSTEVQPQTSRRQTTSSSLAAATPSMNATSANSSSPPQQEGRPSSHNNDESSTSSSLPAPRLSLAITSSTTTEQQSEPGFDDAIDLVMKVKHRFRHDPPKYTLFLTILHKFQSKDYNLARVCELVLQLFRNHPDLLEGFLYFLPDPLIAKAIMPGSRERIQREQQRSTKQEDKVFGQCIVCNDEPRSIAFVPCGHLCVCQSCASKCITQSGSCPICNQKTATTMRIYLS